MKFGGKFYAGPEVLDPADCFNEAADEVRRKAQAKADYYARLAGLQ